MFKLPIRTWVRNAAAVFSARHGSVTEQAQDSQCSRETVYEHACKVEERLAQAAGDKARLGAQEREIQRLKRRVAELEAQSEQQPALDPPRQRQFATTACAMGLSERQTADLLQVVLPSGQAPSHATVGRWVKVEAQRARQILDVLDQKCATKVRTLALDEIFFGGDRPWLESSPRV
jgi:hypothetical protein